MEKNFSGSCKARAKINLGLDVCGIRSDGYHLLSTIMQSIKLYDDVTINGTQNLSNSGETPDIELTVSGDFAIPADEKNTAIKAARIFCKAANLYDIHIQIHIEKRIPSQAGLGGASADAAAVLLLLNEFFEAFSQEELLRLGSSIGADVPFCMTGGTCLCQGIGEKIKQLPDLPEFPVLLIKPPKGIPTPWAFTQYDERGENHIAQSEAPTETASKLLIESEQSFAKMIPFLVNSLEEIAKERCDAIREIACFFRENQAIYFSMTGSGSCVYGIFSSEKMRDTIYDRAKQVFSTEFYIYPSAFSVV